MNQMERKCVYHAVKGEKGVTYKNDSGEKIVSKVLSSLPQRLCRLLLFLAVTLGIQTLPNFVEAETLTEWKVHGLPANLDGVTTVQLPAAAQDAAQTLLHKLENQGYPLAEVRVVEDHLYVTFGEIVEVTVEGFNDRVAPVIHGYVDHLVGTSPTTDQLSHAIALIDDIA